METKSFMASKKLCKENIVTVTLLLVTVLPTTTGFPDFTIAPEDVTITISASIGSPTVVRFFCQHISADNIFWLVNGTSLHDLQSPAITACSYALPNGTRGQRISTLKINPRLEYNETTIACAAVFLVSGNVDVFEPAAQLIIFESDNASSSLPTGFAETPTSLTLAIGERAVFTCQHCETDVIIWRLNGTKLRYASLPRGINIISNYTYPGASLCGTIYSLTILDIVTYNNTMIHCEADVGIPNEASDSALLLTQGQLDRVTDLTRNFTRLNRESDLVIYTWKAPYSLNLTNTEPDVAYCVRVYNVTCPKETSVNEVNDCNVIQPYREISKNFGRNAIVLHEIEVIARTNLDVGLNGTNSTKFQEKFVSFSHTVVTYSITAVTRDNVEVFLQLNLKEIEPSSVIPNEIEIQLFAIDTDMDDNTFESAVSNDIISCPNVKRIEADIINYAIFNLSCPMPLRVKRLFLSSVYIPTPYCTINSSSSIELSTHLIQNITVISIRQSSGIMVSGDILNMNILSNITALGFLTIAYASSDSDLHFGVASSNDGQNASVFLPNIHVTEHQYRASVFSIEHTGLPFQKSVSRAQPAIEMIEYDKELPKRDMTPSFSASLNRSGCIKCSFFDGFTSLRSCVVIASKKIQINSSSGVTNIDVFEFMREGHIAEGCIDKNITDFNIFAFTFDEKMPLISGHGVPVKLMDPEDKSSDDLTTVTIAAVVIILIIIIVIVTVLGIVGLQVLHRLHNRSRIISVHDEISEQHAKPSVWVNSSL